MNQIYINEACTDMYETRQPSAASQQPDVHGTRQPSATSQQPDVPGTLHVSSPLQYTGTSLHPDDNKKRIIELLRPENKEILYTFATGTRPGNDYNIGNHKIPIANKNKLLYFISCNDLKIIIEDKFVSRTTHQIFNIRNWNIWNPPFIS